MEMEQIASLIALIISIILHEMAHGYAANALGDPTARLQGRLSANPLVHIDPLGSIIIPALFLFSGAGMLFGWAKPVPYNPYNLRNQKWGEALVAIAGPSANVFLALVFAGIIRFSEILSVSSAFVHMSLYIVYINIILALFNMLPFPPLDGSKILMALLPPSLQQSYRRFILWVERYGLIMMFVFIFIFINLFSNPFFMVVSGVVGFLTGIQ